MMPFAVRRYWSDDVPSAREIHGFQMWMLELIAYCIIKLISQHQEAGRV